MEVVVVKMFNEANLIFVTQEKNRNGEIIENKTSELFPIELQKINRDIRDKYNERGIGHFVRFKVNLFGYDFDTTNIPYFEYKNRRYSVTDFVADKTGTSYYIEGTTTAKRGSN